MSSGFISAGQPQLGVSWILVDGPQLSNTAILHQIRRDQVTDTCRANSVSSRKRRVLTPNDLKHLVVDEDHEMIYCYVPKVACTNWKRVMMVLTGRGKYSDPMEIPANEAHVSSNLKTLNQYSIPEINHRLKNYMKFLFVREPFERLVSAYRNKFTQKYNTSFHKRYGTKIVRRQRKNATQEALRKGDDVKFEEFVAYLIDPHTQREEPFNEHWQTVYSLCHPCHIHYDLVGKYETLEEDSNYVLQLAGVGNYLKFPTYAKSTRTTDEMTTEFFQNISSLHQTQLYEVYKLDFLMFHFSSRDRITCGQKESGFVLSSTELALGNNILPLGIDAAIGIDLIHIQDGAVGTSILFNHASLIDPKMGNQNWLERHWVSQLEEKRGWSASEFCLSPSSISAVATADPGAIAEPSSAGGSVFGMIPTAEGSFPPNGNKHLNLECKLNLAHLSMVVTSGWWDVPPRRASAHASAPSSAPTMSIMTEMCKQPEPYAVQDK
ncbi:hypothetical protein DV515_00009186 [Chloebia gouldiae]|uniref:Carbohydrate sulfotransferase n=1 Tax=Chloebia gouldiae TaxID=44316 RepID=A0A3L8SDE7_CHLGU|nr:hypothetical protein DV515_00009186 [Chloebia gouldiae]